MAQLTSSKMMIFIAVVESLYKHLPGSKIHRNLFAKGHRIFSYGDTVVYILVSIAGVNEEDTMLATCIQAFINR